FNRQMPGITAVHQNQEFHPGGSSECHHGIQPRTDCSSGVEHVVNQDHLFVFNDEIDVGCVGDQRRIAPAEIIPEKSDVQVPAGDLGLGKDLFQFLMDPVRKVNPAGLQSD